MGQELPMGQAPGVARVPGAVLTTTTNDRRIFAHFQSCNWSRSIDAPWSWSTPTLSSVARPGAETASCHATIDPLAD